MLIAISIFSTLAFALTIVALTRSRPIIGLLFLVLSFFCLAGVFYLLGAPFAAALEVIIYAGAIMTLFLFAIMMLEGKLTKALSHLSPKVIVTVIASLVLCGLLFLELAFSSLNQKVLPAGPAVGPRELGIMLLGPYAIGIELASLMLFSGLIGALHLARRSE